MINVGDVLRAMPSFRKFCSVDELHALVESLPQSTDGFEVNVAGRSVSGSPIHHVRFGRGALKVMFVGFPHPNEPIGGLTVFSLLSLLRAGHPQLVDADIEWHVVPCIDPDGARLNEGWSQQPYSVQSYMRNSHRQEPRDQVDMSFPIRYKRLSFEAPTQEARVLQGLFDRVRPDFHYSLHNLVTGGGSFFILTRDIGQPFYGQLHALLQEHRLAVETSQPLGEWCAKFDTGVYEQYSTRKIYDLLERSSPAPEEVLQHGAGSFEYLSDIHERSLTLVTEIPYLRHPDDASLAPTTESFRQLRLRTDADYKFIGTVILDAWDEVRGDLDASSPFYRKTFNGLVAVRDKLHDGLSSWPYKTRDLISNPAYSRMLTRGERVRIYQEKLFLLTQSYEFVRLLQASKQTPAVVNTTTRLEQLFQQALDEMSQQAGFDRLELVDHDSLARVQLGSGLIVLNSLL